MKDYYDILEIHPDASPEQIKGAYRKLAKEYHPDKNIGSNTLTERIKDINEAKQVLTDTAKKVEYDLLLSNYKLAAIFNQVPKAEVKQEHAKRQPKPKNVAFDKKGFAFVAVFGLLLLVFFNLAPDNENEQNFAQTPTTKASKPEPTVQETQTVVFASNPETTQPAEIEPLNSPETLITEQSATEPNSVLSKTKKQGAQKITQPSPVKETNNVVQLGEQQMQQTLSKIKAVKAAGNIRTNCIQVIKTNTSNVGNAFNIATYLKNNGFIITGREIANNRQEGINVKTSGSCIKVIIGTL